MSGIILIDTEVSPEDGRILDLGAIRLVDRGLYHSASLSGFLYFIRGAEYLCGHNILRHDLKALRAASRLPFSQKIIDTLFLSPLLFPKKPYHALLKDDKLQVEELNNPVNDCLKAEKLLLDEIAAFRSLPEEAQGIYRDLLAGEEAFSGFFDYLGLVPGDPASLPERIRKAWSGLICENAPLQALVQNQPLALAYALALISARDSASLTPPWVLRTVPETENALKLLRSTPCHPGCAYCRKALDLRAELKRIFHFDAFRTYNGEPLQERAAQAAMEGKSLLAVFPTGGGKSLTFQLPALLQGEAFHALTVVISPLQSLMKDQVDHLERAGITRAVTINGLMSPVERADACARVLSGSASLLFISPEQLRSRTVERLLLSRNIARFVIDEAHCFSAWGQDFRVDYLYIGDFIRNLREMKQSQGPIPVSCFTATAKPKVISDIRDYFQDRLGLDLTLFASSAERENLRYRVLFEETDEDKYNALRDLIAAREGPVIVYVSRVRRTAEIAGRLTRDGFPALPYNGRMDPADKIENQEAFLRDRVRVMVATSAFGMGVDKPDVRLVVHYDISDSLENYIQEAGRAGRDPREQAECFVLFNNADLDKHFLLLNQTRLSLGEIQQIWKAVKDLTRGRPQVCCSPLEIARRAGWDASGPEMETRVKTAIAALENAGYVKRGRNVPHVYASSIQARSMAEAGSRVRASALFSDAQKQTALRILQFLISRRSIARAGNDEAESRVDYLADILGLEKSEVVENIHLLRREGILSDSQDMSAWLLKDDTRNKSALTLRRYTDLENFLLLRLLSDGGSLDLKKINEDAGQKGLYSTIPMLRTLLYFWAVKGWIRKEEAGETAAVEAMPALAAGDLMSRFSLRSKLAAFVVDTLFSRADPAPQRSGEAVPVTFSLVGLLKEYETRNSRQGQMEMDLQQASLQDLEDALLYLSRIGAMKLEGGFLVLYNGMEIHREKTDPRVRFKMEDYRLLDAFYRQKIQQIHIVGEYANMMVSDYGAALRFVRDYFHMEYRAFIAKYFREDRLPEISRTMTPEKYRQLFGSLSETQLKIIRDDASRIIVVAAGPGSGKTRVLVHKLASLLLMEDVKHEQLLMLTFSRAAATEFKSRLKGLIKNAVHYVEIKTFHSYCFDLVGKTGSLEDAAGVIPEAVARIQAEEVEPGRIRKKVLVIDEAQDMDAQNFALLQALMEQNPDMRVIAVGDDDQNIYGFRGSDNQYLKALAAMPGASRYEMTRNYRSAQTIVALENAFALSLADRMKTQPLEAVREECGRVRITIEKTGAFEAAVVEDVKKEWKGKSGAILTATNEEALRIFALLKKEGLRARLIQSLDGFRLESLMEIRFLLRYLDDRLKGPVIPEPLLRDARAALEKRWPGSPLLEIGRNLCDQFILSSPRRYRSDLTEFLRESALEDFYDDRRDLLVVSTIHKAKGREYDQVWMMLRDLRLDTPEDRRRLYVGLTRAKDDLMIYASRDLFSFPLPPGVEKIRDDRRWPEPTEIRLQLTHRDVVLSFFRDRTAQTAALSAGTSLILEAEYLLAEADGRRRKVAKLSKACLQRLTDLRRKGYREKSAAVRLIVAWKAEEDPEECWVLLPEITLERIE